MKFYIDTAVYVNAQNDWQLDDLISLVKQGRHEWVFKNINDINQIETSNWYEGFGQRQGEFVTKIMEFAYKAGFYNRQTEDIVIVEPKNTYTSTEYLLGDALTYLSETVWIILENDHYDKYFINALIKNFPNKAKDLKLAIDRHWLRFRNAGGTGMVIHTINGELGRFGNNSKYIRLFVLIDSDKKIANATLAKVQQDIVDICEHHKGIGHDKNIAYHVLYKREIENYLPETVLGNVPAVVQSTYQGYCALSNEQKDFYDLEKGFNNKSKPHQSHGNLYNNLTQPEINTIRNGFRHRDYDPKQNLPPLFAHADISQANLKARCTHQPNPNELEEILEKIRSLL